MMDSRQVPYPILVGGHICLDMIPAFHGTAFDLSPGKLHNIGKSIMATGGAVANTGLALHRLGVPVRLMGKIGNDFFGKAILLILENQHPSLSKWMLVSEEEATSYTIVISPPRVDRMFLHCTGANDSFGAGDVSDETLCEAGLFHFGYPPLMRRMYEEEGDELAALLQRAKAAGTTTSLDMAMPDPESAAGQVDWRRVLKKVLRYVDIFQPSVEEILFMLFREEAEERAGKHGGDPLTEHIDAILLQQLAAELLEMGAAVVVLKLGEHGLYLRTSASSSRLENMGRYRPDNIESWLDRELYAPCFEVQVAGTTGAGDCTIAGFLAGFIQRLDPEDVLIGAVGTGAFNVEHRDATSGIPTWEEVQSRIASGWKQHAPKLEL